MLRNPAVITEFRNGWVDKDHVKHDCDLSILITNVKFKYKENWFLPSYEPKMVINEKTLRSVNDSRQLYLYKQTNNGWDSLFLNLTGLYYSKINETQNAIKDFITASKWVWGSDSASYYELMVGNLPVEIFSDGRIKITLIYGITTYIHDPNKSDPPNTTLKNYRIVKIFLKPNNTQFGFEVEYVEE